MADRDAMPAEPGDLVIVEMDSMRQPDAVAHPADLFEIIDRPAAETSEAIVVLVPGLAEMGMEAAAMLGRERRGRGHDRFRHVERRAGRERDLAERTLRRIVKQVQDALAISENDVVVLHESLVRDAALARRQIERAARQRDSHAERG